MSKSEYFNYLNTLISNEFEQKNEILSEILKTIRSGNSIWIIGNGGSSSTAEHFETDLLFIRNSNIKTKIKITALTSNGSLISAIANDIGFENIFSKQLSRKGEVNDLLFVLSASGNSINLIKAVEEAKKSGIKSIGLLGFDGGKLASMLDSCIIVDTELGKYGPVEDIHLAICHSLAELVISELN
jgi:D-sedoheptulose 7-phosphate isomerase